jgi:hypothetical protein
VIFDGSDRTPPLSERSHRSAGYRRIGQFSTQVGNGLVPDHACCADRRAAQSRCSPHPPKSPKPGIAKTPATRAAKPEASAVRSPGVIERLIHHLQSGGGTSAELAAKLAADFPDRDKSGMLTTVRVQVHQLPAKGRLAVRRQEVEIGGRRVFRYHAAPPIG